ncbi:superinfection immunity protein [Gemmatimonas sp.]|uniref:superinfection immunity protein n=1 Tax=Gemmatimonas sp. TaxID=1962908 RepID=UPI003342972A
MPNIWPTLLALQNMEPPKGYTGGGIPKGIVIVGALILLYFLPSMLAHAGGKRRKWKITAVNVLLGWTVIGWIASMLMVWAYEAPAEDDATV